MSSEHRHEPDAGSPAGPGTAGGSTYALDQLERALLTAVSSADPAVRARAAAKVDRWQAVIAGMADGELAVGSRTPVADTPAWVTLEVAHGGFATGRYLADLPLDDAETAHLTALAQVPGRTDRERLNRWSVSDQGRAELVSALAEDRAVIDVPEQAALPTVALLLARGHSEAALDLLTVLGPLSHRLRFTPHITAEPQRSSALVHRATVDDVRRRLHRTATPPRVDAMNATLAVWNPLHDDLLRLWADTVDRDLPRTVGPVGADGPVGAVGADGADGATLAGGWPCQRFPDDWAPRRADLIERYGRAVRATSTPTRHLHPTSSTARLVEALRACPRDSSALTGRTVGWIRRVLADTTAAGPLTGSTRASLRAQQSEVAGLPTRRSCALALVTRLEGYPGDGGLTDPDRSTAAITPGELPGLTRPHQLPASLVRTVRRALAAPLPQLVAAGVVPSGDVLAEVLPRVTALHVGSGVGDPAAATLLTRTYTAFRRRRSLLLLDLESQVRFDELPWVAALAVFRGRDDRSADAAGDALRDLSLLALTAFPHAVLPNPLVDELQALAAAAGLRLPLVKEVAADIFTGTFSRTWRTAAQVAGRVLDGTLYARYFDLPAADVWSAGTRRLESDDGSVTRTADDVAAFCRTRAAEAGRSGDSWSPAANGPVLEQAQILTTQNLAVLVDALDLRARLTELAPALVRRVIDRIVRSWRHTPNGWHAQLVLVKKTAYAWRQAIFLLSLSPADEQRALEMHIAERVQAESPALVPVARGLEHVLDGRRFDGSGQTEDGGRRLLGWSVGPHWLLRQPTRATPLR